MKRKSLLALMLALVLVFLAACGGGSGGGTESSGPPQVPGSGQSSEGSEPAGEPEYSAPFSDGKYDPPITMTTVGAISPSMSFKNGETMEDNVHTRWALERFGIKLDYLWTSTTQNNAFTTRVRLALSANEPMPDVIAVDDIQLANDLIDSGQFREVGSLFEQYASDMYKEAVNEDPTMWYPFMREDGAYGIPIPEYSWNNDTVLFIRQDWMDNLGLEAPETIEDLEKIMDAFVNEDPDGNGENDTIALAAAMRDSLKPTQATISWLFGAYGTIPEQWNLAEDGSLEYGSVHPGARQALEKLSEWMAKGYLHQEAGLHDEGRANELFTSGRAGIIAGPYWMDRTPLLDVTKNVEGAYFKAYPVPKGPDGTAGRQGTLNFRGAVLINKNYEHPEAFFVYQNYLFDWFALHTEGGEFENGGFAEGYDYAIIDGRRTYSSDEIPGGRVIPQKYTLTFEGARFPSAIMESMAWLAEGNEPRNPFDEEIRDFLR